MSGRQRPRLLVVTAVDAERDAVTRELPGAATAAAPRAAGYGGRTVATGAGEVTVVRCGVGPVAAAAGTAVLLGEAESAAHPYDLVVSAGIGGGFDGRAAIGEVVVADRIVAADLGAETDEGFRGIDELGFGPRSVAVPPKLTRWVAAGTGGAVGAILTVCTATGTDERGAQLAAVNPGARAEAMEGAGVAAAAAAYGVGMVELRAISNLVGRRDRRRWDIPAALEVLGATMAALLATAPEPAVWR